MTRRRAKHSTAVRYQLELLRRGIEELYLRADPRSVNDPELAADLAQYLCLRVSGYLERATGLILKDYCTKNSWAGAQQFANSWLDRIPNLSADALTKLVSRFDQQWSKELVEFLEIEERKGSLNALNGIRNGVAHGQQQGLSRERAWAYFELVEAIVDWLLERFDDTKA